VGFYDHVDEPSGSVAEFLD